jgi:CarD family transcriptional regulator
MFKKGEKVIYPKHGAGKIIDIFNENINKEKVKYLKIQFFNSQVTVSIPIPKAEEMGLRYPLSRNALKKALKSLNKKQKINKKTLITLDFISKEKMNTGKIEDAINLVNLLKSLAKQKEEENKNFSYSYSDRLEIAVDFIKSEVLLVLGKNTLKKYMI